MAPIIPHNFFESPGPGVVSIPFVLRVSSIVVAGFSSRRLKPATTNELTCPLRKLYFWGECPKSGGGFQPPRSGWKPLPLCAAKLREGHTSKVRPKGDKFSAAGNTRAQIKKLSKSLAV